MVLGFVWPLPNGDWLLILLTPFGGSATVVVSGGEMVPGDSVAPVPVDCFLCRSGHCSPGSHIQPGEAWYSTL